MFNEIYFFVCKTYLDFQSFFESVFLLLKTKGDKNLFNCYAENEQKRFRIRVRLELRFVDNKCDFKPNRKNWIVWKLRFKKIAI
jgi:hypothetical protein